jgi:hypothetical protein
LLTNRNEIALLEVRITELLRQGDLGESTLWTEITELLEQRRKLVDSESRRLLQQQETLTSSEAYLIFNALVSVIKEHVADRETLAKIQADFAKVTSGYVN